MASRKNAKFSTQVQFYLKHRETRILKLCNDTIGSVPNDSLSRAIFKLLSKPVDNRRIIQLLADKRSSTKSTASHSTVKTPQTTGTPTGALTATIPTSLATASAPAPASLSLPEYQKDVERFRGRIICQDNTCIIDPMASPKNDNNSNPRTHSFRIVSFSKESSNSNSSSHKVSSDCSSSPLGGDGGLDSAEEQAQNLSSTSTASTQQAGHKAILMCFSCKLSFGTCRSFIAHAKMEHSLTLNDYERMLLEKNYSSAIIQTTTEKQFYFLVPFEEKSSANNNNNNNNNNITSIKSSMESGEERFKSGSGTGSNGGHSQQLSPLQQAHHHQQQQQQQLQPTSVQTPEKSPGSISYDGVYPKLTPSSMLYDMDNKLQASWKLAAEKYNNAMNESVAAAAAAAAAAAQEEKNAAASGKMLTDFLTQQKMLSAAENLYSKQNKFLELMNSNPLAAASAKAAAAAGAGTDGASDYHLAKKYNAMDLYKQLMAANTFRPEGLELKDELKAEHQISVKKLETEPTAAFRNNSFAPNISTRNSCKTLKCPQCNWHYKYQETLEIHMREKHPDGETACSYCLAGQQHPRLARGESYTCGYKPYRCDICNYSTTTKGNLSIHMQSDKHLNNMQDLNGMMNKGNQNFLNLATLQANEKVNTSRNQYMPATSPLSLSTKLPQQTKESPSSYEPNRPKSFFKCDICNYDTNIARNLRIHMTSEKHISNLNSLQSSYNQLKNLQTMSSPESLDYLSALNLNALKEESPLNRVEDYTNSTLKPLPISSSPFAPIDPTPVSTANSTPTPESLFLNNPSPFSGGSEAERSTTSDFQQHQQHQQLDEDKNPLHFEPPIRVTLDPSTYYTCLICSDFDTNNLEELKKHVIKDRLTSNIAMDTIVIAAASCECLLCGFRASPTADKQHELERHLKSEAHLKRLDLMIHLLEGRDKAVGKLKQFCGTELFKKLSLIFPLAEESKFPFEEMPSIGEISRSPLTLLLEPKTELIERDFGGSNGIENEGNHPHPDNVQIKCNCCNYYTTSLEKIGLHSLSEKHIFRRICFDYLLLISSEKNASSGGPSSPLNLQHNSMKGEDGRPGSAASLLLRGGGQLMLTCVPCGFKTDHIYYMIHHLRKSCKVEQNINLLGLRNIFKLTPKGADSQDAMDSASAATGDNSGGAAVSALCSILQEKKPWNGENCNGKTGGAGSGGDGTCKDRCLVCSVCNNFSSKKINVMQHLLANHNIGNELLAQDFPSLSVPSTIQKKPFDYLRTLTEARSAQNLRLIEKVTFMNDSFALKENCNDLKHGNLAEILENYMGGKGDGEKEKEKHQTQTVSCPLCPETFLDQVNVETHVIRVHNIKMEGLNRLLKLVDTSQFLKTTKQQQLGSPDKSPKKESTSPSPEIKCSFCKVCFDSMVDLKIHCNESNHFKRNADSEDLACFLNDCKDAFDNLSDLHHHFKANHLNFLISENHTYKYRCKLCPFAFKTHEKLNRHLFYHSLRESTKCFYCDAHFKNINSLTSHIAEKHPQESSATKGANEESASILFFKDLKRKMLNSKNGMSPKSDRSQTRDSADEDRLSEKSMSSKSSFYYDKSLDGSDGGGSGGGGKFACSDCRFSFTDSAALERHMATAFHMSKEREKAAADSIAGAVNSKQQLFYDIKSEKFTNPNRPFKCTICMESFTQKNILLVHYNSVSHLNKLKKFKSDKQQQQFQFQLGASMGDSGDGCEHGEKLQHQQQQQQPDFKAFGLPMFAESGEKRKDIEEKETARKKFKCDICNVAYTQGSTLDIHMRSVLHQTRACRLQERSMFGSQLPNMEKKKSDFPLIQTIPESHESPNFIDDTPMRKIKSPAELQQQQSHQQQQPLSQPQLPQQPPPPMLNPMMGALGLGGLAAVDKPEIALCECCFQVFPNKSTLENHLELSPECSALKKKMMENNPPPENFADGFQQQALNELAKVNSLPGFDLTPEALLGKTPFPLDPTANLMDPNFLKNASLLQFATDPTNKLGPNALNVLNFMHFHHLMSLSYLNLAPQLNFGAVPGAPKVPDMTGKSDLEKAISAEKSKMQSVGMPQNLNGKSPLEMNLMAHSLESKMPPQPPQQQPCTQKRARTRITDEQLRILRSHFDINNSPSEESIQEMSLKANLPPKVVKHWFRNTLFKERQRSKDSPYNFSIPPSTKLNVEEYERTGETKVTDLDSSYKSNESQDLSQNAVDLKMNEMKQNFSKSLMESLSKHQATQEMGNFQLNKNLFPETFGNDFQPQHEPAPQIQVNVANFFSQTPDLTSLSKEIMSNKKKKIKSESSNESPIPADLQIDSTNSSPLPMRPPSVISLKKHMDNRSHGNPGGMMEEMKIPSPIDSPVISPPVSMAGGMHQQMAQNQSVTCSNGKRANRTRFTDYQIKVLQEFFENNSYPKDSDLEYLSKLLMLSPRVIVVWFQNARQKQRKIYENQPNPTFETDEKKAININYTCKKCNLVFQRYYELIRHQKNHCFKEESNKRSAKAQLAAAQIAHSFTSGSEDSDSSLDVSRRDFQPRENDCPF
ncbi:zinc finger protein 2 isoform X2 [Toxorhynchites rutilus septentrionalis]|uniref:zinc finger protein 2 isoform X2 n=1 Tax=Toxorhynchites rutilus septentrionalis TaxID=329112 RepID=UPI00247A3DB9|nr:zinc finger protein 2 isoform X2 [Toxorhynchites rutilus septentrionalis]